MRDAYDRLFLKYRKEEFFKDGIDEIIFADPGKLVFHWNNQKQNLLNNGTLFIRNYGRNGIGTKSFLVLYKHLFLNENIKVDSTNNARPAKALTELTGCCKLIKVDNNKKEKVQNYQVSHLFGRTKNPLLFTAGWNVAYIPKYLDPFTGHETRGDYKQEFQSIFFAKIREMFRDYIEDYNDFIYRRVITKIEEALHKTKTELEMPDGAYASFALDAIDQLSLIEDSNDVSVEVTTQESTVC